MKRLILSLMVSMTICLASPALAAEDTTDPELWWGEFCSESHCLRIANVREGPMGWYFSFALFKGDTAVGDAMAALEGDTAVYYTLRLTMQKDGKAITVTLAPGETPPEEEAWIKAGPGVYTRVP